jgi:hypothetical protein
MKGGHFLHIAMLIVSKRIDDGIVSENIAYVAFLTD